MLKHQIRTPEQALVYLTDCTLATVGWMASLKSRKKGEYERQISIAQTGYDWAMTMGADISGTRLHVVWRYQGSVAKWAKSFEV